MLSFKSEKLTILLIPWLLFSRTSYCIFCSSHCGYVIFLNIRISFKASELNIEEYTKYSQLVNKFTAGLWINMRIFDIKKRLNAIREIFKKYLSIKHYIKTFSTKEIFDGISTNEFFLTSKYTLFSTILLHTFLSNFSSNTCISKEEIRIPWRKVLVESYRS